MGECPFDVAVGLRNQRVVLQQIRQRQEAVEIVRTALPALARSSEPATLRADVGPELVEPTSEPFRLNLELAVQPALGSIEPSGSNAKAPG